MDHLDHLADAATDLLRRVDDTLVEAGAPEHHPIWPLLRRVRALPGEAAAGIFALRPWELAESGRALRRLENGYDEARAALAAPLPWQGPAAEAYRQHRVSLTAALGSDDEWGLAARLDATASYLDDVARWAESSRIELAATLVEVLTSAEAVTVRVADPFADPLSPSWGWWPGLTTPSAAQASWGGSAVATVGDDSPARAAAEIGARVLGVIAECLDRGEEMLRAAMGRLTALSTPHISTDGAPTSASTTWLEF
ncbi:MAG TPA: hypothetical protein VIL44_09815 [Micromonospora sp.]